MGTTARFDCELRALCLGTLPDPSRAFVSVLSPSVLWLSLEGPLSLRVCGPSREPGRRPHRAQPILLARALGCGWEVHSWTLTSWLRPKPPTPTRQPPSAGSCLLPTTGSDPVVLLRTATQEFLSSEDVNTSLRTEHKMSLKMRVLA